MARPLAPPLCATDNKCEFTEQNAPPCGVVFEHCPPFMTSESVCVWALNGRLQRHRAELAETHDAVRNAETLCAIAWYKSELGMVANDEETAARYFAEALESADSVMRSPYSWFAYSFSAALLHVYRPTFMARRQGEEYNLRELQMIRRGLGGVYDALLSAPIHAPQKTHILEAQAEGRSHRPCLEEAGARNGLAAKLIGMMLAARKGVLLHPASRREAQADGDFIAQNHDAYQLFNGEKYPVKLRLQGQSNATGNALRPRYDEKITYINMRGLINVTLQNLKYQNGPLYRQLLRENKGRPPDVIAVGCMLRDELDVRIGQTTTEFLDALSAHLLQKLSAPQQLVESLDAANAEDVPGWEILPAECLNSVYRPDYLEALRDARRAHELYHRYGNSRPSAPELQQMISAMRQVTHPRILTSCAGAYIDLARSPETFPQEAVKLVEAAEAITKVFIAKDWRELDPAVADLLFRCALQNLYADKYKKALSGQSTGLQEEARLYTDLLQLGVTTLRPGASLSRVRGVQFEIAIHLLNARINLRSGTMAQVMWPSLPREDASKALSPEYSTAWDSAVTRGNFLEQDPSQCRYLQLKGHDLGKKYDPSITVIVGSEDLGTTTTADIIRAAVSEHSSNTALAAKAKAELNSYEERFLQKLAWE